MSGVTQSLFRIRRPYRLVIAIDAVVRAIPMLIETETMIIARSGVCRLKLASLSLLVFITSLWSSLGVLGSSERHGHGRVGISQQTAANHASRVE